MIKTFRKLRDLLTPRERRGLSCSLVILLVGIFETFGIASVLPFMAVLSQPERIQTTPSSRRSTMRSASPARSTS